MRPKRGSASAAVAALLMAGLVSWWPAPLAAQSADDPAALRELTLRALGDATGARVTLLPGRLPDVSPALAVPAGWRVIGTVTRTAVAPTGATAMTVPFGGGVGSMAFLDGVGTATDAMNALTTALTATGWRNSSTSRSGPIGGGFVTPAATTSAYALLCGSDTVYLNATAIAVEGATEPPRVTLSLSSLPVGIPAGAGPCGPVGAPPVSTPPSFPAAYAALPRLTIPATAQIVSSNGGGGGQYSATSSLTIDKASSVADLDRHFSPQMQTAGWRRLGGSADATVATSVWRKTVDSADVQAVLTLVNALGGDQRRDLSLVVSSPAVASSVSTMFAPVGTAAPFPVPTIVPALAPAAPTVVPRLAAAPVEAPGFQAAATSKQTAAKKQTTKKKTTKR